LATFEGKIPEEAIELVMGSGKAAIKDGSFRSRYQLTEEPSFQLMSSTERREREIVLRLSLASPENFAACCHVPSRLFAEAWPRWWLLLGRKWCPGKTTSD